MKSITKAGDLTGKRVLVRVDWSVPTADGVVLNDYQIKRTFPTIEYLQKAGAKVILISHAERDTDSLKPIFEHVKNFLPLTFIEQSDLMLLENLRQNKGERENSNEYAKELASLGDIFVNEAFPVSHREHASIVGVPKLMESYVGMQFSLEIEELSKAFYPKRPFLFILGGAKFDTKIPLLKKFINIADSIFVGGAIANNFLREQGVDIGNSLVGEGDFKIRELLNTGKIILPEDTIIKDEKIMDAGPITLENLKPVISSAKLVLWNGPLGNYEMGYKVATLALAKMIAEFSNESIIGGGDTLAAVKELDLFDKFSFVSTGGGAMLDFLANGTLPGIEALK
ncbi:MAG: phosphoglycerate kinase [Candidatus Zambryskibacteria bacterium CG11_big_fil_rev_8_21_14_0_20_42_18]|uniref:Phosphoglycerate kinase n=1 Tax=Candidatus Zambryskibacteria bacterium CG_4_9_14_3_um_filter_42_15 TaxID=1975112 RepID=A0A2M7WS17_9BACT|nr:MAG: phosphoglycerate kinase [Candidatus Zambryskibacteria bacterium CG11_big_fil_rev_8_21_14_0_20_42_18]PJA32807.1 MAG: phosphoglycerate kinase [Candidatus Zambryskibacteria bacterium CG_4_9_14_3_um_filter_42_15]